MFRRRRRADGDDDPQSFGDSGDSMQGDSGSAPGLGLRGRLSEIADAAEQRVAQIEREALETAQAREREVRQEMSRMLARAEEQSRKHVEETRAALTSVLTRADQLEERLSELMEGVEEAIAGLDGLRPNLPDLPNLPEPDLGAIEAPDASQAERPAVTRAQPVPQEEDPTSPPAPLARRDEDGEAGRQESRRRARERREERERAFRTEALELALGGASRNDVSAALQDRFALEDSDSLLNEVFERVERDRAAARPE